MRCQPYYVYDNSMLHGPATTLAVQFRPTAFGHRYSSCPLVGAIDSLFSPSSAFRIIENFETPRFATRACDCEGRDKPRAFSFPRIRQR